MSGLLHDLRYAMRLFGRARAFYGLLVLILGLGIAFSVSVFSLVDGVLLRPLPYREPQRLVALTSMANRPPFDSNGSVSYHDFLQIQSKAHAFSEVAATFRTGWSRVTLSGDGGQPVTVQGAFVSPNFFRLFGRSPVLGRTFTADENRRAERLVVIGAGLWAQRFASSPDALGQDLLLTTGRWKVIGVMPADFQVPFLDTQVWAPLLAHPEWNSTEQSTPLERPRWDLFARLQPALRRPIAEAQLASIWQGLRAASPEFHKNDIAVVALREHFTGAVRRPLLILLSAVGFLLLIALANVANLLLARSEQRRREFAIRAAIGAGKRRIVRQLATEALAISCLGGLLGVVLANTFVPLLKALVPAGTPLLQSVDLDNRELVFATLLSIAAGFALGMMPAWPAAPEANGVLKAAGLLSKQERRGKRLRSMLVVAEFALAMLLLTGAALFIRSLAAVWSVDPGFKTESVLAVQIGLTSAHSPAALERFYADAAARVGAIPGVRAVGAVSNLFFFDEKRTHALRLIEGHAPEPKSAWTPLVWTQISGDYFQAMGIPLLRGRFLNARDDRNAPLAVIINQTLARRYWPHEEALGKRLKGFDARGAHDDWLTVVGIVADMRSGGLERKPFSQIYEAQAQSGESLGELVVRTAGSTANLAPSIRAALHNLDRSLTVPSITTVRELLTHQETQRRFETWLLSLFSGLALGLAALGVFAVMHYSVMARRGEIGLRVALGAKPADISRLVLGGGTRLALCGIVVGAAAALVSTRALSSMLYTVKPGDPLSFALAAGLLLAVASLAAYVPATEASRVDPMDALRQE